MVIEIMYVREPCGNSRVGKGSLGTGERSAVLEDRLGKWH